MINRQMSVEVTDAPRLVFNPSSAAAFEPIAVEIPPINGWVGEGEFSQVVLEEVRRCCGNAACSALVFMSSSEVVSESSPQVGYESRIIQGARISCSRGDCPLIDPPFADDNEPLIPQGNPPALQAEAEAPAELY